MVMDNSEKAEAKITTMVHNAEPLHKQTLPSGIIPVGFASSDVSKRDMSILYKAVKAQTQRKHKGLLADIANQFGN